MLHCALKKVIGLGLESYSGYVRSCGSCHWDEGTGSHFEVYCDERHKNSVIPITKRAVIGLTFLLFIRVISRNEER